MRQILRMLVFKKTYGLKNYLCVCCKSNYVNPFQFEVGHIKSKADGGKDTLNNLIAICRTCNSSSGTKNYNSLKIILKKFNK